METAMNYLPQDGGVGELSRWGIKHNIIICS